MSSTAQTTDAVERAREDGLRAQAEWSRAETALREAQTAAGAGRPHADLAELDKRAEQTYQDHCAARAEWEHQKRRAAEQHGTA